MRRVVLLCALLLAPGAQGSPAAASCPVGKAPTGEFKPFGTIERTGPAVVIGCGKHFEYGRFELVAQRGKQGDWRGLIFDAQFEPFTGPLAGYWIHDLYAKKGDPIRSGGMGGTGDGWRHHSGVTSGEVRRVVVRYKRDGEVGSVRMTLGRIRGERVEQLDLKRPLGFYAGWIPPNVKLIDVIAQDRDGKTLGRDSLRIYNDFD